MRLYADAPDPKNIAHDGNRSRPNERIQDRMTRSYVPLREDPFNPLSGKTCETSKPLVNGESHVIDEASRSRFLQRCGSV